MHKDIRAYNATLAKDDKKIVALLARELDAGLKGAESKIWHRTAVWFIEGNPVAGYSKRKDNVQLLFWSGQSFKEKGLIPEGSFKAAEMRYVSVDDIAVTKLRKWIKESKKIQWDYKNIVKRKGKLVRLP